MTQQDHGRDRRGRRAKRFLSPSQKYGLWLQLVTGELSQREAAERFGIDRSTVMRIRQVAKQGALAALAASTPGGARAARTPSWPRPGRRSPGWARRSKSRRSSCWCCGEDRARVARRRPPRVDATTKAALLELVDQVVAGGFTAQAGCRVLQLLPAAGPPLAGPADSRDAGGSARWRRRGPRPAGRGGRGDPGAGRRVGRDRPLPWQARPPRLPAGPGGGWAASVFRVLVAYDLVPPKPPGRAPVHRAPWPDGLEFRPNQVWGWEMTTSVRKVPARGRSRSSTWPGRTWLAILVSAEETATQVQVVFGGALQAEGLAGVGGRPPGRPGGAGDR
jgi:hypothetical protein